MKKEKIQKEVKLLQDFVSVGYEIVSFNKTSAIQYPEFITIKVAGNLSGIANPKERMIKLLELLTDTGYELLSFYKIDEERTSTIELIPLYKTKR
jgi:hypothetical protein